VWAIARIALAEFTKAFAPKAGTASARDFASLTVFFALSAFLVFLGWSARNETWARFEQVLLGALPEGGPPVRVTTHIDLAQKITAPIMDKFARDFPALRLIPMRDFGFDSESGAVTLPGLSPVDNSAENDAKQSWGDASDGARAPFRNYAIPLNSPLWDWIRKRNGNPAILDEPAPLVVAANKALFRKHFRYNNYRNAVANDHKVPCLMRTELPEELAGPAHLPDTLFLAVKEAVGLQGSKEIFHSFNIIWVDSFPLPEQVALIMPLSTAEIAGAPETWRGRGLEVYLEGQGKSMKRVSALRLKDIDLLSSADARTEVSDEFRKIAACLGAVPAEQTASTLVCGTPWTLPTDYNSVILKDEGQSAPQATPVRSRNLYVPQLETSSFEMVISPPPDRPLRTHDVEQCIRGTRFANASKADPAMPQRPGGLLIDFTRGSSEVAWKSPARIELPCSVFAIADVKRADDGLSAKERLRAEERLRADDRLEQGSCKQPNLEGARGVAQLRGYNDAMIYAREPGKSAGQGDDGPAPADERSPGSESSQPPGNLDDIVARLRAWKVDDTHQAFRLDAAYESALVRFGVLSAIVREMTLPIAIGMLLLYLALSGVILSTTLRHRRSQYGLLFMYGVKPGSIHNLVWLQVALGCTIGCVIGYAGFRGVAYLANDGLKSSSIIEQAAFVIGLDVPSFLDNLGAFDIFCVWAAMMGLGFVVATILLLLQGILTARAPINLIKS
jgi:hypothetical protein